MKNLKLFIACFLTFLLVFSTVELALGQEPDDSVFLPLIMSPPGPCSVAPILISPTNGSNPQTLIPTFQWENGDVQGVTEVNLFISLHPNDFPTDWEYWVTSYDRFFEEEQYLETNLPPSTTYYWQVWMRCGEVESPHSEVWSFTTGADGTILPGPTLLYPAEGAEIWSGDLPLTLLWSPVTGAIEYKVTISKYDSGIWYRVYYDFVTEPYFQIPFVMTQNTDYQWTVKAINDYAIGLGSSRQFKTMY